MTDIYLAAWPLHGNRSTVGSRRRLETMKALADLDGFLCAYCATPLIYTIAPSGVAGMDGEELYVITGDYPTIDHVLPRSRGGGDELDNLVLCCHGCNASKSNRTPSEWLAAMEKRDGRGKHG